MRGGFPKKKRGSSFLNGLNRARMEEEEKVGEGVVSEEKGVEGLPKIKLVT